MGKYATEDFSIKKFKNTCTYFRCIINNHSWAQHKLSSLNPLNILLSINGLLLSYGFNGLKRLTDPINKNLKNNTFNGLKKFNEKRH